MCISSIKQVLSEKCSQKTQGKYLIYSINWHLLMMPKHGVMDLSVISILLKNYKLMRVACQKYHKGKKSIEPTKGKYSKK